MAVKQSLSFALEPRATASFDDYVADCAWSPDGKSFAIAGGEGKVGAGTSPKAMRSPSKCIGEHMLGTLSVAWQPHAHVFATSGQDGAVALWDAARRQARSSAGSPRRRRRRRWPFRPTGEMLASAAGKVGDAVVRRAAKRSTRSHPPRAPRWRWPSTGLERISGLP